MTAPDFGEIESPQIWRLYILYIFAYNLGLGGKTCILFWGSSLKYIDIHVSELFMFDRYISFDLLWTYMFI